MKKSINVIVRYFVVLFLSLFSISLLEVKGESLSIQYDRESLLILNKNSYTIGYSTNHNQAIWCMYHLNRNDLLNSNKVVRTNDFRDDESITNILKHSILSSYNKSGFDKGHLCPAQDRSYSLQDMSETFLMSNMSPQEPSFNRGIWKRLEIYTRNYAITHTNIIVITGPVVFDNNRYNKLNGYVTIPDMYYKILVRMGDENTRFYECYLIPHSKSNIDIKHYNVALDYLETIVGIHLQK